MEVRAEETLENFLLVAESVDWILRLLQKQISHRMTLFVIVPFNEQPQRKVSIYF